MTIAPEIISALATRVFGLQEDVDELIVIDDAPPEVRDAISARLSDVANLLGYQFSGFDKFFLKEGLNKDRIRREEVTPLDPRSCLDSVN